MLGQATNLRSCASSVQYERRHRLGLNLIDVYVSCLAVIIIFVAYLDLGNYFQVITYGGVLPKYVYFALVVGMLPLLPLRAGLLLKFARNKYAMWTLAMVALNIVHWMIITEYGNADQASLILTRVQFILLGAGLGFVLLQASPRLIAWTFIAVGLLLTGLQVFDFFSPSLLVPLGTEGLTVGRAGSTLVNSNRAAESLVLLSVFGMAILRPAWRLVFLLIVFPGIAFSFSRVGIAMWVLVAAFGYWLRLLPRTGVFACAIAAAVAALVFGSGLQREILSYVDFSGLENIISRVTFFSSLDTGDDSAQERFAVALNAVSRFLDQPIVGQGAGYTYFWNFSNVSTHNQLLLILSEYGIMGLSLFAWLVILMYRGGAYFQALDAHRLRWLAFTVFCLFALFTHNMFDSLYWLVTIALLSQARSYGRGTVRERTANGM